MNETITELIRSVADLVCLEHHDSTLTCNQDECWQQLAAVYGYGTPQRPLDDWATKRDTQLRHSAVQNDPVKPHYRHVEIKRFVVVRAASGPQIH